MTHHDKVIESQQGIHNEVLKGAEEQENCCFKLKSGIGSRKDQVESKENPFDFPFEAIFGIGSLTFVQIFFQKLKGRVIVSFSLTFVFGTLYLMGSYYIKVHSVYSQKKEGPTTYKQQTLFVLAYFSCFSFSFAIPCAWFLCWSYSTFSPKKVTIFEMFTSLTS